MNIAILGAGAMGCLLASYLSEQAEVWLIDSWQEQIDTITQVGLSRERDGQHSLHHPHASSDPALVGPCDIVLVLVKAHQTRWAAQQAQLLMQRPYSNAAQRENPAHDHAPALLITLQNGIGNAAILAETLGSEQVSQAVTSLGATLLGPGRVRHAGMGSTIFANTSNNAVLEQLIDCLNACALPAERSDNLDTLIWSKLIVNVGINALTALLRVPNGMLTELPEARHILAQAVAEALDVATARGISVAYNNPVEHVLSVAHATAGNHSSMLQDVLRGSPTEIGMINGAVARAGRELGVPTPVNDLLSSLVRALDMVNEQGKSA